MQLVRKLAATHGVLMIQFIKFGIVGSCCFCIDLIFFKIAFNGFGWGHYASAFFSFPFAALFGWIGNRLFTFRGKHEGSAHAQLMRFLTVTACGLVLNRGTYSLLTATVPLVFDYPVLGLMAGTGVGMFFNFFFARKLVFR